MTAAGAGDLVGVVQSFGPQSGWRPTGPPIPLGGDATPDYQAQIFATAMGDRAALVVAEWGEAGSAELGEIVYCAVRDAEGLVLEEVGRNPMKETAGEQSCPRDDDGHCA